MHSLHRRHLSIAFLLLFTLVVNASVAFINIRRLVRNERAVARTYLILAQLENVVSLAKDAETGQRGFILTGDERYLEPFRAAQTQLGKALDALAANVRDPDQKREMPILRREVQLRLELARHGIALRRQNGFAAAQKWVQSGVGKRKMDDIRRSAEVIQGREQDILQERADESTQSAADATRTFWIASGANILLLALVSGLLWRSSRQNAQLELAYADLKRAESMRDGLSAMLVHDLRTPLTTLLGPLQMLHAGVMGPLDESQREVVAMSQQSGMRLLKLINELLDIAKMEAGEMKIERHALEVAPLIEAALREVGRADGEKSPRIQRQIEPTPPIWAENDLILRVLINLVGNALKFTPRDGQITVGVKKSENFALFWVRDTGEGIPSQDLARVFDKFGQVESRQAGRKMSSGLGLTFCRLAVEAHGGKIWVESEIGQGSTFFFTIPFV